MKLRSRSFLPLTLLLPLLLLCPATALHAAPATPASAQTPPAKTAPAATPRTNATPEELPVPRSTFVIPTSPKIGRDPFFPDSARTRAVAPAKAGPTPTLPTLVYHGTSGMAEHRLATINSSVFATGDEADVVTPAGRVRVRCIEIRDDSVLIEINGQRQELRFLQRK